MRKFSGFNNGFCGFKRPMCPLMCPSKACKRLKIRKHYRAPKPRAEGSSPSAPATNMKPPNRVVFCLCKSIKKEGLEAQGGEERKENSSVNCF